MYLCAGSDQTADAITSNNASAIHLAQCPSLVLEWSYQFGALKPLHVKPSQNAEDQVVVHAVLLAG